jgi:hypothetical protein
MVSEGRGQVVGWEVSLGGIDRIALESEVQHRTQMEFASAHPIGPILSTATSSQLH